MERQKVNLLSRVSYVIISALKKNLWGILNNYVIINLLSGTCNEKSSCDLDVGGSLGTQYELNTPSKVSGITKLYCRNH